MVLRLFANQSIDPRGSPSRQGTGCPLLGAGSRSSSSSPSTAEAVRSNISTASVRLGATGRCPNASSSPCQLDPAEQGLDTSASHRQGRPLVRLWPTAAAHNRQEARIRTSSPHRQVDCRTGTAPTPPRRPCAYPSAPSSPEWLIEIFQGRESILLECRTHLSDLRTPGLYRSSAEADVPRCLR